MGINPASNKSTRLGIRRLATCRIKKKLTRCFIPQILYSVLDQKLHGEQPLQSTTTVLFNRLHEDYYFLKPVDNTGWQLRFTHLVGYGARCVFTNYPNYLFSLFFTDIIRTCFQDPLRPVSGKHISQKIHSPGMPVKSTGKIV